MEKIIIRVEVDSDDFYSERKAASVVINVQGAFSHELLGEALADMVEKYQARKAKEKEDKPDPWGPTR